MRKKKYPTLHEEMAKKNKEKRQNKTNPRYRWKVVVAVEDKANVCQE